MLARITDRTVDLSTVYRRYRLAAAACLVVTPALLAWVASGSGGVFRLGLLLVGLYAVRKTGVVLRLHYALRQLTLEQQFLRYLEAAPHLSRRLFEAPRIRRRSCLAAGLNHTCARPARTAAPSPFAPLLRRLRVGSPLLDAGLPAATFLGLTVLLFSGSPSGGILPAALVLLLPAEAYQLLLRRRARTHLTLLMDALQPLETTPLLTSHRAKSYRHTPLYVAPRPSPARPRPARLQPQAA
ncbi:MAG: hypothetical protein KatS3mg044_1098 [Rhodothermaceae bacterium]|nr:MAG: hypothetical protein KatS3mg044_1098 [Rhodothermaceae bacterium]